MNLFKFYDENYWKVSTVFLAIFVIIAFTYPNNDLILIPYTMFIVYLEASMQLLVRNQIPYFNILIIVLFNYAIFLKLI